jgi:hypothetical protein
MIDMRIVYHYLLTTLLGTLSNPTFLWHTSSLVSGLDDAALFEFMTSYLNSLAAPAGK